MPTTLISDTFTDTDAVHLHDHTIAPTNTPATAWVDIGGLPAISSNAAIQTETTGNRMTLVNAGVADCTISANVVWRAAEGLWARATTSASIYGWLFRNFSNLTSLFEKDSTYVSRASTAQTLSAGTSYSFSMTCSGTTISGFIGAGATISYASATFNQTETRHGINIYTQTTATLDNFLITVPSAGQGAVKRMGGVPFVHSNGRGVW